MLSPTSAPVRRALVTATPIAVAIAAAASLSVVWQGFAGTSLSVSLLVSLLPFAVWSYGLRTLRWHTLARSVNPGLSPIVSCYSQIIGFAFSATPGRIAEVYKLKVLERSTGTPIAQSLPAMVIERLTDAAAFGVILLAGGLFHWSATPSTTPAIPLIVVGALLGLLAGANWLRRGRLASLRQRFSGESFWQTRAGRWILRLPGGRRYATIITQLQVGGSRVVRPGPLALGLLFVALGRLGDGVILWQITREIGYPLPFALALIVIGSSGLVGGATLAPGGVGTTEATLVGLIVAQGTPLGPAVVATFGMRTLIFWLWVVLGLGVFTASQGREALRSVMVGTARDGASHEPSAKTTST